MPTIVSGSVSILSDAGLGMAMFSLGNPLTYDPATNCKILLMMKCSVLVIVANKSFNRVSCDGFLIQQQVYSWLYSQRS